MDALLHALHLAQRRLDQAEIRNAVIGGLAVAIWGRPRLTDDVDLKVAANRAEVDALVELMAPEFQPVPEAVPMARSLGVLFLDGPLGVRLDLLLWDLYKMITTRPRDREDVRSIVVEQGRRLDRAYIEHWLGLFEEALDDSTLVTAFRDMAPRS